MNFRPGSTVASGGGGASSLAADGSIALSTGWAPSEAALAGSLIANVPIVANVNEKVRPKETATMEVRVLLVTDARRVSN